MIIALIHTYLSGTTITNKHELEGGDICGGGSLFGHGCEMSVDEAGGSNVTKSCLGKALLA